MQGQVEFSDALREAQGKVLGWVEGFIADLPNLIAAIILVVAFWLAARLVRRVAQRVLARFSDHKEVNRIISGFIFLVIVAAGLFVALGVLDLDKTVTSLLAGAGILGLALSFAFQDTAQNFIAGILLSIRREFRDGDLVKTNDFLGTVVRVDMRETILRTMEGQTVVIPNSQVFQNPLVNFSRTGVRRVDLPVGISYGDDLETVRRVAVEAVEGVEGRLADRPVELFYTEFGDSSINFTVRFWIPFSRQVEYMRARSDAIMRVKHAFDESGITIPFPIRTLDFGIVGGTLLSEELARAAPALSGNGDRNGGNGGEGEGGGAKRPGPGARSGAASPGPGSG